MVCVKAIRRFQSGDDEIQNRTERPDLRRLRRNAARLVFGREVAAELRADLRLAQRRDDGRTQQLPGDADLTVIADPDELRDESAMHHAIACVAQLRCGGERQRHLLGDDDRLIDRDRVRRDPGAAPSAFHDVPQRPPAG
jgi:hypothetical protein